MIAWSMIVQHTANGEGIFMLGWGIWLLLCLGLGLLIPVNRGCREKIRLFFGWAGSAAVLDLIWLAVFFPSGEYVNRGAAWGLMTLLCGGAVVLAAVLVMSAANTCIRRKDKTNESEKSVTLD